MDQVLTTKDQFLCGDYVRLSREDGDKLESDSISHQKELISQFHKTHPELQSVGEYVDDGYSGTSFERPGFQRLLEDAASGKINCIIVKDLSRFGRNYIETGRYLERIFPSMGLRFISINDHYDSLDEDDDSEHIIIPFKNLINDAYCRDISMKIKSQLDVKRKNGKFVGGFPCYGYKKDPEDKGHFLIDEEAAEVVRNIFLWKLDGMSPYRIADRLDEMGILPPFEYKRSIGLNVQCGFRSGKPPKWCILTIYTILTNEMYTGTMVQGRHKKASYKSKQCQKVSEEEWIKVPGTHEAIVSKQIFDEVQGLLKHDTRTAPGQEKVYLFAGFLKCGTCGESMGRRYVTRGGKKYYYYRCSTYRVKKGCTPHNISEKKLEAAVVDAIRTQIDLLVEANDLLEMIHDSSDHNFGLKEIDRQILRLNKEVDHYQELKTGLYKDMCAGIITNEEYQDLKKEFTCKISEANEKRELLGKKRSEFSSGNKESFPWLSDFCKYKNFKSLDRRMLAALVEDITVYEEGRIEIHFRYGNEMGVLLQELEEYKEGNVKEISS